MTSLKISESIMKLHISYNERTLHIQIQIMFWIFFTLLFAAETDETESQEDIFYSAETAKPGDGNQNECQLNVFKIKELKMKQIDLKSKSMVFCYQNCSDLL